MQRNSGMSIRTQSVTEEQIAYIAELIDDYNLIYVEDPIQEEDFEGFAAKIGRAHV